MDVSLHTVLKSHLHSKALLKVGESYGFSFHKSSSESAEGHGGIVNLGSVPYEDLEVAPSDAPRGYEEVVNEERMCLTEMIQLKFQSSRHFSFGAVARLTALEVFPRNNKSGIELSLVSLDGDLLDHLDLALGNETTFYLQFTMPTAFCGHLKRLILFTFEVSESVELLVSKTTTLKMGVVVLGNIVPRGVDRNLKLNHIKNIETIEPRVGKERTKLSMEAKAFAPISAITHFDIPCNVISIATSPFPHNDAFRPPRNYTAVLNHPTLLMGAGFAERLAQELNYLHHLRANTLEQVMNKLELCTIGDLVDKHSLSSALSYQYCQDILSNHVKLVNLEEIQTKIDIAQFDMHYVRLNATIKPTPPNAPKSAPSSQLLIVKLKIRGSSENRPNIGLGTEILLRPVQEDLYLLAQYHLLPQMFEIRGVCIHYQLSTEEATFEFPGMINPPQVPFLLLFSALRYHIRFDYERYGFLFIQWAVGSIMSNQYLVESLFPNDDTILRLKAYFKTSKTPPVPPGLVQNAAVTTSVRKITNIMGNKIRAKSAANMLPVLSQSNPFIPPAVGNSPDLASLIHSVHTVGKGDANKGEGSDVSKATATAATAFNPQQLKAITTIGALAADDRFTEVHQSFTRETKQDYLPMPPFIIFGPPGTGKTSTVVESILRICNANPYKRILACAPSDAAADVLCDRLSRVLTPKQLFRLCWYQRVTASLPAHLRAYSCLVNDVFEVPTAKQLEKFQVVVCNCGTAGVLKTLQATDGDGVVQLGMFDVVMVDEASQTIEAEIMVPLEFCKPSGVMVLSGDTSQLGPSTRCPLFNLCSDGASLQERLLRLPYYAGCSPQRAAVDREESSSSEEGGLYQSRDAFFSHNLDSARNTSAINLSGLHNNNHPHNNRKKDTDAYAISEQTEDGLPLGVFLYKNYRSHRRILEVPSSLFYGGALQECGDPAQVNSLCGWDKLPQTDGGSFPLLMIGVDGKHEHEVESPSFFNTAEIDKVVEVCRDLLSTPSLPAGTVVARDIGVIAAFRKQVLKLRLALRAAGLASINVGSVEDFQGQEVKVVVISTVLSEWVDRHETKGAIGLIGDPKRFNVAVTRGMALCVVIGQPQLLYADPHWRELIRFCVKNGAYSGMDLASFMPPQLNHESLLETAETGKESGSYLHDQEDEDLLNSVTEVANAMLMGQRNVDSVFNSILGYEGVLGKGMGVGGQERSKGQILRGHDMEWRSIM